MSKLSNLLATAFRVFYYNLFFYYLLHTPLLKGYTMQLCNGKTIHATLKGKGTHFEKVTFNGKELKDARITHQQLMAGGELVFHVSNKKDVISDKREIITHHPTTNTQQLAPNFHISYTLNRQFRTWPISYVWQGDTLLLTCKETTYKTARKTVENATGFCWDIPADGAVYQPMDTFAFISMAALKELKETGRFTYDGILWRQLDTDAQTIHVRADIDRTEMWISTIYPLPFVVRMKGNPLGIDWTLTPVPTQD